MAYLKFLCLPALETLKLCHHILKTKKKASFILSVIGKRILRLETRVFVQHFLRISKANKICLNVLSKSF